VEEEAASRGRRRVGIEEVRAAQARYLNTMEKEIKGYRIDACFGTGGCPRRAIGSDGLFRRIEETLQKADLLDYLKTHIDGPLRFHHEFTVTLADCPNACSQPQIRDIGIIGAAVPRLTDAECTRCGACEAVCKETAVSMEEDDETPRIDMDRCLYCGQCAAECQTGTLAIGEKGYRVLLGGKLGRHPRLGMEMPGLFDEDEVAEIVEKCLEFYKEKGQNGQRFAALVTGDDIRRLSGR
jgi:dissimilatory sulfite reductase (desulfoviridin) alpha/beta subunit